MPVPRSPRAATRRPGRLGAALVLLALWAGVLAPAANLRAALAAADPLAGAVICGRAEGATVGSAEQPIPAAPGCGPCPLCCTGLAAPVPPAAPDAGRAAAWTVVAWAIPPPVHAPARPRSVGQPRAPPRLA